MDKNERELKETTDDVIGVEDSGEVAGRQVAGLASLELGQLTLGVAIVLHLFLVQRVERVEFLLASVSPSLR
jgi:hypothetical protein